MAKDNNHLGIPMAHMGQAVSDGELNMSARSSAGSSSSLPGTQKGPAGPADRVLSWAVSFEKLLDDPTGVYYFTDFLNSEVSAENIMFWQACEEFKKIPATSSEKLKTAADSIYQTYLASSAPYAVNITDTARNQTGDLERPTPDMFDKAQSQIFKLMKMDSYRRFVRSPLYQSCSLASVEGRPLPCHPAPRVGSLEDVVLRSPSFSNGKMCNRHLGVPGKQLRKRGSWGAVDMASAVGGHMAVKSTSSVELGSLYRPREDGRSCPSSPDQGGRGGVYCCVYLPDGSASLAPTRPGLSLSDMLAGLCEKRGFPLKDVIIYLQGNDKPLSMEQDCSVLRDQTVTLEIRVKLTLEVVSTGKTTVCMVKSSKTLGDAVSVVLQRHELRPQDTLVTMAGSSAPLEMCTSAYKLANQRLLLHSVKDKDQSLGGNAGATAAAAATQDRTASPDRTSLRGGQRPGRSQPTPSKNLEIEGLLDLLSRAQCCRVDDQRGPLTKEHLEVPDFLLLPPTQQQPPVEAEGESCSTTISTSTKTAGPEDAARPGGEADGVSSNVQGHAAPEPDGRRETSI